MEKLTKAQQEALEWFAETDRGRNWSTCRQRLHPWTFGSLAHRGLINDWNDPHRDEVWEITDAGRAALARAQETRS